MNEQIKELSGDLYFWFSFLFYFHFVFRFLTHARQTNHSTTACRHRISSSSSPSLSSPLPLSILPSPIERRINHILISKQQNKTQWEARTRNCVEFRLKKKKWIATATERRRWWCKCNGSKCVTAIWEAKSNLCNVIAFCLVWILLLNCVSFSFSIVFLSWAQINIIIECQLEIGWFIFGND